MKVLLSGYNGAMGREIAAMIDIEAGYSNHLENAAFSVYDDLSSIEETFDVIIDFSSPKALKEILNYAVSKNLPVVVGTTGLGAGEMSLIDLASSHIPILQAGNYSLGMQVMMEISELIASKLKSFDVEIIEKHHNKKVDAPSGSALMLRDAVMVGNSDLTETVNGRSGSDCKREPNEIGMHAVRGGTIVGEHSVIFAGLDEVIEIKHSAYSKKIFASGAIEAARLLIGKPVGRYDLKDVL